MNKPYIINTMDEVVEGQDSFLIFLTLFTNWLWRPERLRFLPGDDARFIQPAPGGLARNGIY